MRNPDLVDIVLTDCRKTVLHGQVSPEVSEYLLSETRIDSGWAGRIAVRNVCQVVNWRNENGFTGLLALGPVTNKHGSCLLSVRAPLLVISGSDLTGAASITPESQGVFWGWSRA